MKSSTAWRPDVSYNLSHTAKGKLEATYSYHGVISSVTALNHEDSITKTEDIEGRFRNMEDMFVLEYNAASKGKLRSTSVELSDQKVDLLVNVTGKIKLQIMVSIHGVKVHIDGKKVRIFFHQLIR